ncbi:MAG: protein kinase family protein, partial [Candidatus Dormibacteria bacterium]
RDIKPSNCLLTDDLSALKITDFGLARAFGEGGGKALDLAGFDPRIASHLTTTAGTPQYMAPEQFQPGATLDTRSDIYSFGIMFYQMLTMDLPPLGFIAHQHITMHADRHDLPEPLKQIVLWCVAPDPRERPDDFALLRDALDTAHEKLTGMPYPFEPNPKKLEMDATDWNDKAIGLENLGYVHEARACFERALAVGPSDASSWLNYGGCLTRLGRFDEALSCYDQGLKIDAQKPALWSNKGVALESCRRGAEARACYLRSLELNPEADAVWMNLGANFVDAGQLNHAVDCYDRSLEINPRNFEALSNKAEVLLRLKRYSEALECCGKGITVQPRDHGLWNRRACALLELERLEDALLSSDRALEIEEAHDYLWQTKGRILERLGRNSEAEKCFGRARALTNHQSSPGCVTGDGKGPEPNRDNAPQLI